MCFANVVNIQKELGLHVYVWENTVSHSISSQSLLKPMTCFPQQNFHSHFGELMADHDKFVSSFMHPRCDSGSIIIDRQVITSGDLIVLLQRRDLFILPWVKSSLITTFKIPSHFSMGVAKHQHSDKYIFIVL